MPGNIFFRRVVAWTGTRPLFSIGRSLTAGSSLSVRGGGGSEPLFSRQSSTLASASATDSSSRIDKEAQSSLSIVGSSVQPASMEGIRYLNTRNCSEFRVLFVLGGPGAGKGTQSDLMKENYPCVHLSAGELLRAETKKEESPHKELIEKCLVSGNIVPVEISLSLLEAAMKEAADKGGKSLIFLIDGFPRNFDNLHGWVRCMKNVATVWGVLNYQCPLEELERRILNRAKDSGRSDDNLQSARKRFATFEQETVPVVDTLRNVESILRERNEPSLCVFDISGDQTVEEVWAETQAALNHMISYDVLTAQSQLLEAVQKQDAGLYRQVCAEEWFEDDAPESILQKQEGDRLGAICNVKITFESGTKVAVEYDRTMKDDLQVHEKRLWSYEGGWKNIHFSRLPVK